MYEDNEESNFLNPKEDDNRNTINTKNSINNSSFSVEVKDRFDQEGHKELLEYFSFRDKEFFSKRSVLENIPAIIAIIIYCITLKGCHEPQFVCLEKYPLSILKYVLILIGISALFFTVQFFLYIHKVTDSKPFLFSLFSIIFLCFIFDTGSDLGSHGSYNRIVLFIFIIFYFALYYFIYYLIKLFKKHPLPVVIGIILIGLLTNFKIKSMIHNSCYNWTQGFNDTFMDNSRGKCKIPAPKICYFEILNGVFDFSKFFSETCQNVPNDNPQNTLPNTPYKNAKVIGFPRSENWNFFPDSTYGNIQKTAMKNVIDMEDPKIKKEIKERIEVTVDYNKTPAEVKIDLKVNQKLIEERAKIFEKYKDKVLVKNVFYVFIDSLSRVNFRRKLPKLYAWFEAKHHARNQKNSSTEKTKPDSALKHDSFQMLKYHGVGRFTGINMVPALLGVFNVYYNGEHFISTYKNHGYITGQTLTFCGREVFDMDGGAIERMKWDNHDHEMISLFCDGNFTPFEGSHYPLLTGPNSIRIRCLYGKSALSYSLEYTKQFFTKYRNQPKFFKLGITEAHEGTNEVIKYSDDELLHFFKDFEQAGHLDETAVILHSDHGVSMIGPYSAMELEDFVHELVLPSLFFILPKSMQDYEAVKENFIHNENSIVTPFNLFNTFKAFLNDRKAVKYAFQDKNDIINNKISRDADCDRFYSQDYYEDIEFICRCKNDL